MEPITNSNKVNKPIVEKLIVGTQLSTLILDEPENVLSD